MRENFIKLNKVLQKKSFQVKGNLGAFCFTGNCFAIFMILELFYIYFTDA